MGFQRRGTGTAVLDRGQGLYEMSRRHERLPVVFLLPWYV